MRSGVAACICLTGRATWAQNASLPQKRVTSGIQRIHMFVALPTRGDCGTPVLLHFAAGMIGENFFSFQLFVPLQILKVCLCRTMSRR